VFGAYATQVIAQPALPAASGTAVLNTSATTFTVTVTGGTLTGCTIGGVAAGTGGTYTVPGLTAIALSWSVAPASWSWTIPVAFLPAKNANGSAVARTGPNS
jgi:hypothetical protein